MVPLASLLQYGEKSPLNAGTKYTPLYLGGREGGREGKYVHFDDCGGWGEREIKYNKHLFQGE